MPEWKKNIFVRVIRSRIEAENRTAVDIIAEYTALTEIETTEILNTI